MARVDLTDDAKEDIRDLDGSARKIVLRGLKKLESEPEQRGQPLGSQVGGNLTGLRKLTVGNRDYRIVFRVTADGDVVVVYVVGRRSDSEVYALAAARFDLHEDPEIRQIAESIRHLGE